MGETVYCEGSRGACGRECPCADCGADVEAYTYRELWDVGCPGCGTRLQVGDDGVLEVAECGGCPGGCVVCCELDLRGGPWER